MVFREVNKSLTKAFCHKPPVCSGPVMAHLSHVFQWHEEYVAQLKLKVSLLR